MDDDRQKAVGPFILVACVVETSIGILSSLVVTFVLVLGQLILRGQFCKKNLKSSCDLERTMVTKVI